MPCKPRRSGLPGFPHLTKAVYCHSAAVPCALVSANVTVRIAPVFGTLQACAASRQHPTLAMSQPHCLPYRFAPTHPLLHFRITLLPCFTCMLALCLACFPAAESPWQFSCPAGSHPRLTVGCCKISISKQYEMAGRHRHLHVPAQRGATCSHSQCSLSAAGDGERLARERCSGAGAAVTPRPW